ncbi:enoyl-CoA hydratase-related protein [Sneathiella chinensis]|uniref:Enoyl-CoA hydratase n=1 Tax=Sneathiella chinensis TaxID=349750 RepID=A0ABQ5U4G1_9PROT|nr:enoyl-CoA hydratase-related protein [Sneathiella chinensis]GLQ06291.1 enoyl-CoA hydratase [Sneathiella chinensis]
MSNDLLENIENGIATLTMNRPQARNAFSQEIMTGLLEKLTAYASDKSIRAVVLTGAGGAFSAGGDVKGFASKADGAAGGYDFNEKVEHLRAKMDVSRILHEMPKPTLAVIPGPAAGAGFSLALACDMRIATETAKMTTAFSKVGLSGDFGGSYFLTKLVGMAKARELYFTGKVLSGKEAEAMGIVNKAVPEEDLAEAAAAMAAELASLPTIAVGFMKKNLNNALHGDLNSVLDWEAIHMISTFDTEDHKGAAKAFVEKRVPEFKGR